MLFLLKNTLWQSRKKKRDLFRHIYHGSPSWLHFPPYLTQLSYSNSAKFSNMKEAESVVLHLVLKNRSQRYLQTAVGSAHSPLRSHSSPGGWSTLGWLQALVSLFHPSTTPSAQCPSTFSSCTLFPDQSLTSAMDHSLGFWTQSSSQAQEKPSPRIRLSLWSPLNLSLSTPSLPGFPSQFPCQARMSPPWCPQWHSSLLRSASHFPWIQLFISLLSVSLSAPFLLT